MRHASTGVKLDRTITCKVRALADLGHRNPNPRNAHTHEIDSFYSAHKSLASAMLAPWRGETRWSFLKHAHT
jgi:hypothetical protein